MTRAVSARRCRPSLSCGAMTGPFVKASIQAFIILKGWPKRFCRTLSALFSPPGTASYLVQQGGQGLQETEASGPS